MVERRLTAWLRPALAFFGIAGILLLAGCGGGSGAPNNPYTPPPPVIAPLLLLPSSLTVYAGTPATLTISGGVPPYRAFSTNASILPVAATVSGDTLVLAANNVTLPTTVAVTVQDFAGTVSPASTITVQPAPLLASLITITSNPNPACAVSAGNLCSGSTGTATVKVTGNGGVGIAGRSVKFDVVQGSFSIVSNNPGQPLVPTLTVSTDGNGNAVVVLSVPANTPTQTGIIRATDVASGNQITGTFVIQQTTVGGQTLAVLPLGSTTINGPDSTRCSSGVSVTNYIFGGTPPYQVAVNFPGAVTLTGVPVLTNGGAFTTTTNGTCFINLTYVISDANGLTIPSGNYPTVTNQLGTGNPIPPPSAFTATPGAIAKANCVPANTFQFIMTGGTSPYSVVVTSTNSSTSPVLIPQTGLTPGAAVTVSGLSSPSSTTIAGFDTSSPRQSVTVTIDCSGAAPPPSGNGLVVAPTNYTYSVTCVSQTSNFVITGGTPPYTVFFSSPRPGATISPTTVAASGQGFSVTGLSDGVQTTNIVVQDSSTPQLQQVVTITCPIAPPPVSLVVTPTAYSYSGGAACSAAVSQFVVTGGTAPYTMVYSGTTSPPPSIAQNGNQFTVTGLASAPLPRIEPFTVRDAAGAAQQSRTVSITCNP
jgi:hypothetical protein